MLKGNEDLATLSLSQKQHVVLNRDDPYGYKGICRARLYASDQIGYHTDDGQ